MYYAAGLVVATSRVYVKIHHASDVVAGLATGLVLGAAFKRMWPASPPPAPGSEESDQPLGG